MTLTIQTAGMILMDDRELEETIVNAIEGYAKNYRLLEGLDHMFAYGLARCIIRTVKEKDGLHYHEARR